MLKCASKFRGLLNVRHTTADALLRAIRARFIPGPSSELIPVTGRRRVAWSPGARAYGHDGPSSSDVKLLFTSKWTRPGGNIVSYAGNGWTAGSRDFLKRDGYSEQYVTGLLDQLRSTARDAVRHGRSLDSPVTMDAMRRILAKQGWNTSKTEQYVQQRMRRMFNKDKAFAFLKEKRKQRAAALYDALLHRGERMQMRDFGDTMAMLDHDVYAAGGHVVAAPAQRNALSQKESLYRRLRSIDTPSPYWENKVYGAMPFSRDAIGTVLLRNSIDGTQLKKITRLLDARGIPYRTYSGSGWIQQALLSGSVTR